MLFFSPLNPNSNISNSFFGNKYRVVSNLFETDDLAASCRQVIKQHLLHKFYAGVVLLAGNHLVKSQLALA